MLGHAAFDARHHLVLDADIGERAAHHDLVVTTARAVGVEVQHRHLMFAQIVACGAVSLDVASW